MGVIFLHLSGRYLSIMNRHNGATLAKKFMGNRVFNSAGVYGKIQANYVTSVTVSGPGCVQLVTRATCLICIRIRRCIRALSCKCNGNGGPVRLTERASSRFGPPIKGEIIMEHYAAITDNPDK